MDGVDVDGEGRFGLEGIPCFWGNGAYYTFVFVWDSNGNGVNFGWVCESGAAEFW